MNKCRALPVGNYGGITQADGPSASLHDVSKFPVRVWALVRKFWGQGSMSVKDGGAERCKESTSSSQRATLLPHGTLHIYPTAHCKTTSTPRHIAHLPHTPRHIAHLPHGTLQNH